MKIGIVFLGGCIGVIVAAYLVAPPIIERVVLPPELRAGYEDWKKKEYALPPEAVADTPFEETMLAAAQDVMPLWEEDKEPAALLAKIYTARRDDDEALAGELIAQLPSAEAEVELNRLAPLLEAFEDVITRDDYKMAAFAVQDPVTSSVNVPNFLFLQTMAKLLALRSEYQISAEDVPAALATSERILLAGRCDPFDTLIAQLIAIAMDHVGTIQWHRAVAACEDPVLLRGTLAAQNRFASEIRLLPDDLPVSLVDKIGMLRNHEGELEIGEVTEREVFFMAIESQAQNKGLLPMLARKVGFGLLGPFTQPSLYKIGVPNFLEAHTRRDVMLNRLDLLRLETASKLYRLEHGTEPASIAALVPDYLPNLPADRFVTENGMTDYLLAEGAYYSVGPNRQDEHLSLPYDPTNGTLSAGDIRLQP